ncbi:MULTISPECIES: hypothetical protein [Streptomyces]|uniref:Uncharacterized protein n=1 Tax=Streptomyces nigrescens TaxID=1920 RepID=A0A640TI62_STRNI|nr:MULTISPECIES: hypothetical protein [Streptomyces]WAT97193.1 hypothetical protein STRLI_003099 [Streptomyces libani subsp. libani]WDT57059.1 hypothetical protein NUT86_25105 [Streptomyces sp. G7(2002)]SCK11566.1 hypothetical protein YWIDRAFT_00918 [Streptomyces sp. SceaMP-e96]GFE22652.1 hypothetical protein Sliba_31050 [Streptomyces libani subsp. libani]GGV91469.1 hypothetical protein GCM10010500_21850 [Streptomyces libani subsp. libani]
MASVVAVVGTLLGSGITHVFQSRSADRSERFARAERLRQERIDAYCAYAGALLEYRRVLVHRWFVLHEDDRCGEDTPELREEVYKTRYSAQEAMFRAQMVSDDPEILDRSEQVMAATTELHWAPDREALTELRATTRQGIRDFIAATSRHVR